MKTASLAMVLGFAGICLPAHAGLIGSTVDVASYYPNLATLGSDGGTTTVSNALEYANIHSLSVDITDTQLLIGWPGPGNVSFTGASCNGCKCLLAGVTIFGATVDAASTFAGSPAVSVVGNTIFVNFSGLNSGIGPTTSVIDVSTSASTSPTPEPSTLTLLAAGVLGIVGFRYKRRSVQD